MSYTHHMVHTESITIRVTAYRKRLLESLAREKNLTLSDLLRYSAAASFAIFENKTPEQANNTCLRAKGDELLEQLDFEKAVEDELKATEA